MELSVYEDLQIMENYGLTPEEWFITQLIFLGSPDEGDTENYLVGLYSQGGIMTRSMRENLQALKDKGIILQEYKIPNELTMFDPEGVLFNDLFMRKYFQYSQVLVDELMRHYPAYIKGLPMTNVIRSFPQTGRNGLNVAYGKAIRWRRATHEKVLNILDRAVENNLICYGICEFVLNRKWEELERLLDEGVHGALDIMDFVDDDY